MLDIDCIINHHFMTYEEDSDLCFMSLDESGDDKY